MIYKTMASLLALICTVTAYTQEPKENVLTFGSLMDLSSHLAGMCEQVKLGLELGLKKINDAGGIQGKQINLMILDDGYEPQKAREKALELINQHKIDIFLDPFGAPTTAAYLDLIKEKKVLAVFPFSWEKRLRIKDYRYLLSYRATAGQESGAMAHYALTKLNAKRIVVLYQTDIEANDGAEDYFKKTDFKDFVFISYERRATNFEAQVKQILDFNPDTFILLCIPTAAIELIRQIGVDKLYGKNFLCWSSLQSETFKKALNDKGFKPIRFSTLPDLSSDLPIVKEFMDIVHKNNLIVDPLSFGGYLSAVIFGEILKRIKGPITKEAIVEVYENIKNLDFGGLELNYNPQEQTLCSKIWFEKGDNMWSEYKFD